MNITKGEIKQDANSGRLYSTTTNDTVVMDGVALYGSDEAKANTKLFLEALTTANKTGLTPKQLLEKLDKVKSFVQEREKFLRDILKDRASLQFRAHINTELATVLEIKKLL